MTAAREELERLAGRLTVANRAALITLPTPRDAQPHRMIAARPYGSTWRKSTKHYDSMVRLEDMGIVERTVSRGETLWRLTRPLGLSLMAALRAQVASS